MSKTLRLRTRLLAGLLVLISGTIVGPAMTASPAAAAGGSWIEMETDADPTGQVWVVDVAGYGIADRSPIHTWEKRTSGTITNQLWTAVVKHTDGTTRTVQLFGNQSSKCLDKSEDHGNVNYAAVYIYTCSTASNQLWLYNPNPQGWSDLRSVADPGRCLTSFGPYEGAPFDVEDCATGYIEQSWRIDDLPQ
jgi:hypothetical protein